MSKILSLLSSQVGVLYTMFSRDTSDEVLYGWDKGSPSVRLTIQLVTVIVFIMLIVMVGLYLWNRGLHPVFPSIIAPIDGTSLNQFKDPYRQLIVTVLAIMMFF